MDRDTVSDLLAQVAAGKLSPEKALERLRWQPVEPISDFARLDHHRALRQRMPEFVYGESKSPEQVARDRVGNGRTHGPSARQSRN